MVDLLLGLWDASLELSLLIWREANRWTMKWIRMLIVLIITWPVIMVISNVLRAFLTVSGMTALALLPAFAILVWIFFCVGSPLVWFAIFAIPLARKALLVVLAVLSTEAAIGICFAFVQPAAGAMLLFGIIVSFAAMIAFWKFAAARRLFFLLGICLCTIWFISIVQHADSITKKMQALVAQEQEQEKGMQQQKPSPEEPVIIPTPLAPARPNGPQNTVTPSSDGVGEAIPTAPPPDDDDPNLPPKQVAQTVGYNSIVLTAAHRLNNKEIEFDGFVTSDADRQIDFSLEEGGYVNLAGTQVRIWRQNIQFGDSWHAVVGNHAPTTTSFTIYVKDPSVADAKVAMVELNIGVNGNVGMTPWFKPIRVQ